MTGRARGNTANVPRERTPSGNSIILNYDFEPSSWQNPSDPASTHPSNNIHRSYFPTFPNDQSPSNTLNPQNNNFSYSSFNTHTLQVASTSIDPDLAAANFVHTHFLSQTSSPEETLSERLLRHLLSPSSTSQIVDERDGKRM